MRLDLNSMERFVLAQALTEYNNRAEIEASEYEVKEAKDEKIYGVPLIHPRVIANTSAEILNKIHRNYDEDER